ncbi:MAG: V-type ATP synthase subunit D [Methanoregula sp.]|jgi:V/A-type H+-transporting ATPase subunit D
MQVKRTQGELKRQRDALGQYERYLPTLQLKKQQLQLEISHQQRTLAARQDALSEKKRLAAGWLGLLVEAPDIRQWLLVEKVNTDRKNIAGIEVPLFHHVAFVPAEYDLFVTPLWVDAGLDALREMVSLQEEIRIIDTGIAILNKELRVTSQRVNLFEKVKIPGAQEAIRLIRISLGDQLTNAIGRSKIAKKRIEESDLEEACV